MAETYSGSRTAFVAVGANATPIFGLSPRERAERFARKAGLEPVAEMPASGPVIVADLDFAWDPAWLGWVKAEPGRSLVWSDGRTILAHHVEPGTPPVGERRDASVDCSIYNAALRKRQDAYAMPLAPETTRVIEKASYDGAYKGVTDLLTLYLWRGAAFHLTRWAAAAGISPNMVTAGGAALCVWAFFLFWEGHYWTGLAVGLGFMVLDTVDGKLARCTGTSSKIGNVLDHGIDLVHPPFWYWAWGAGLAAWGEPMAPTTLWWIMAVIVVGYIVQRLIEGAFIRSFGGIHIHVWRPIDSRFRLITARRNPNMVILFVGLLLGEPDTALVAVAWWTALSCLFHLVRLIQAYVARGRGEAVVSWLA